MSAADYASRGGYRNFGGGGHQQSQPQRSFGQAPQQYARAFAEMPRQSHRGRSMPADRPTGYNSGGNRGGLANSGSYNRPYGQKRAAAPESNLGLNPGWSDEDAGPDTPNQTDAGFGQQQQPAPNFQSGGPAPPSDFQASGGGGMNRESNFQGSGMARESSFQSGARPPSGFQSGGGGAVREPNFQASGGGGMNRETNYPSRDSNFQGGDGGAARESNYPSRDTSFQSGGMARESNFQTGGDGAAQGSNFRGGATQGSNFQGGGGGMAYQSNYPNSGSTAPPSTPQRPSADRPTFGQGFGGSANKTTTQQQPNISPKVPFFSDNVLKKSANSPFQQSGPIVRPAEISPFQQQYSSPSPPVVNSHNEVSAPPQRPMDPPQSTPFYGEALAKKQAETIAGDGGTPAYARNFANSSLNPDWRNAETAFGAKDQYHSSGPKPANAFTASNQGYCGGSLTVQRDSSSNMVLSSEGVANTNTATTTSVGANKHDYVTISRADLVQLCNAAESIKAPCVNIVKLMESISARQ